MTDFHWIQDRNPWLEDHISAVTDALQSRMNREACGGIYNRFQLMYRPSAPGERGGLAVVTMAEVDNLAAHGWQSFGSGLEHARSMTRQQVRAYIDTAAQRLPILDPGESGQ